MIPQYNTKLFSDIYPQFADFSNDYNNIGFPTTITSDSLQTTYCLLLGEFGNSPIVNFSEHQWKLRLFSTIFRYGPTWEKRLDIQQSLRGLSEDALREGSRSINNLAENPNQAPTVDEASFVSRQNVAKYRKSAMAAYGELWELLRTDVTGEYLDQFRKLFVKVVTPQRPTLYVTEESEDEEDEY